MNVGNRAKALISTFKQGKKKLILHFDVNKTLILSDEAGGKALNDIINQVLMQSTFGFAKDWDKPGLGLKSTRKDYDQFIKEKWFPIEKIVQTKSPKAEDLEEIYQKYVKDATTFQLMSFDSFVSDVLYPYPKNTRRGEENEENTALENELQVIENKAIKQKRKEVIHRFTNEDELGYSLFGLKQKIFHSLLRLKAKKDFPTPTSLSDSMMKDKTQEHHFVFILPGFFKLIVFLIEHQVDFNLVFRTFGNKHDIEMVLEEFNSFCQGKHPLQAAGILPVLKDLKSRVLDLSIPSDRFGYTFRSEIHAGETLIVLGSLDKLPMTSDPYKEQKDAVRILKGAGEFYQYLTNSTNSTFMLRDYYEYWSLHNEHPSAGKLYPVNPKDSENCQIFFDDNAYIPSIRERGIIDVRHPDDESSLYSQYKSFERGEIVHVYPFESAVNDDYFIQKVIDSMESFSLRNKL